MFELLFLLLPVAAAYGYIMGRNSARQKQQDNKIEQNSNYLKGFDYLLNNKQEKAVDKFIAYLNSKDPSFESSIAMGNLFRQQGQVDKAIALHEKMSNDKNLDDSEKELSLLELSRDYLSAGLLDRAEELLLQLVDIPRQRDAAARLLLSVYEKEQDFEKAIKVATEYFDNTHQSIAKKLCHYYCELSKQKNITGDKDAAFELLHKALKVNPNTVRARLCLADTLIAKGQFADAYKYVKEVSTLDSGTGIACLERIQKCFPNNADPNYRFALEDLVHRTNSAKAMVELVKTVEVTSSIDDALALLQSFIKTKSNLKLLSELLELNAHQAKDSAACESILSIKRLIDAQVSLTNTYECHHCGFESKMLFYQCPSCRRWESLKTKVGFDGD